MTVISADLKTDLAHFTGTEQWYSHWTRSCVYTDGVKFFAEKAGAYWFLDIVATELVPIIKRGEDFLSVLLAVKNDEATITVRDGNGKLLHKKAIRFTDCPPGDWPFYVIADQKPVVLLPSEY